MMDLKILILSIIRKKFRRMKILKLKILKYHKKVLKVQRKIQVETRAVPKAVAPIQAVKNRDPNQNLEIPKVLETWEDKPFIQMKIEKYLL